MVLSEYAWLLENQYIRSAVIFLIFVVVAKAFQLIGGGILKRLTKKTETDIDDIIVKIASRPVFYLIVVVGLYVTTRPLTIIDPVRHLVGGFFFTLGVIVVSWLVARILVFLTTRWFIEHKNAKGSPKLINIMVSVLIYIAAGIVVLSYFNVEVTPLVAALGVGGLAIGLALQDTLGNVFAGIHLISDEPVRVHDIVEVKSEGITGEVLDIGWRSTRIKTFKGNTIIIPNSKLAGSTITNYEMPGAPMRAVVECGVDYGSDLKKVEKISLAVGKEIQEGLEGAVQDFHPIFRYHEFADSNVNFRVILEAKTRGDTFALQHEFMKVLHERFDREGIEISWPVTKQYNLKPSTKKIYKGKTTKLKKLPAKKSAKKSGKPASEEMYDE